MCTQGHEILVAEGKVVIPFPTTQIGPAGLGDVAIEHLVQPADLALFPVVLSQPHVGHVEIAVGDLPLPDRLFLLL